MGITPNSFSNTDSTTVSVVVVVVVCSFILLGSLIFAAAVFFHVRRRQQQHYNNNNNAPANEEGIELGAVGGNQEWPQPQQEVPVTVGHAGRQASAEKRLRKQEINARRTLYIHPQPLVQEEQV